MRSISQLVGFSLLGHSQFLCGLICPSWLIFPLRPFSSFFVQGPCGAFPSWCGGGQEALSQRREEGDGGEGWGPGGGVGEGARRIRGAGAGVGRASEKRGRGQSSEGSRRGPTQETGHAPPAFPLLGPPCRKAPPAAVTGRSPWRSPGGPQRLCSCSRTPSPRGHAAWAKWQPPRKAMSC